MAEIDYIQLESAAFLTDIDFQMMNAEQRGVYCSIIFWLYCNNGKLELVNDNNANITLLSRRTTVLANISNCFKTGQEWEDLWNKIAHKFEINGNLLTHKRVSKEIQRAKDFIKMKSEAGKKGMQKRWGDNTVITKERKVKESKGNNTPLTPLKGECESDFDKFWKIYPKKKSKGQAKSTWEKLKKAKRLPELAVIQDAIAAAKVSQDWQRDAGQYIPHPSTWLNAEGWLDEYGRQKKTTAELLAEGRERDERRKKEYDAQRS